MVLEAVIALDGDGSDLAARGGDRVRKLAVLLATGFRSTDHQQGTVRELFGPRLVVPIHAMRQDFTCDARRCRSLEGIPEIIEPLGSRPFELSLAEFAELIAGSTRIPRIQKQDTSEMLVMARMRGSSETTHAVTAQHDSLRVYSVLRRYIWLPHKRDCSVNILRYMSDGKHTGASPSAAIVHCQHIPTCSPNCLGKVEVLLVARDSMQQDDRRVGPCASRQVEQTIHPNPMTGDQHLRRMRRMGRIRRRIRSNHRRNGRRLLPAMRHSRQAHKQPQSQPSFHSSHPLMFRLTQLRMSLRPRYLGQLPGRRIKLHQVPALFRQQALEPGHTLVVGRH